MSATEYLLVYDPAYRMTVVLTYVTGCCMIIRNFTIVGQTPEEETVIVNVIVFYESLLTTTL